MIAITIDRNKCTNCLQCINACPKKVLISRRPIHVYTECCTECGSCLSICPEDAIIVVKY